MIRRLRFNVEFYNGRVVEGDHPFSSGTTTITGANEAGKTLRLEMIRFALFGSAALRGRVKDYKTSVVTLDFEINGEPHQVKRSLTGATLDKTVTGTKPVNAAIEGLLGFGMDVFDVANACNQGEVEALGAMTPTQRKGLIDKVIGLDRLDATIDELAAEARDLGKVAQGRREGLRKPVEPACPIYLPARVEELEAANAARLNGLAFLNHAPKQPHRPEPHGHDVEQLEKDLVGYQSAYLPPETAEWADEFIEQQLALHEKWENYNAYSSLNEPEFSESDIDRIEVQKQINDQVIELEKLLKRREQLVGQGSLSCPECGHEWAVRQEDIRQIDEALAAFDVKESDARNIDANYVSREFHEGQLAKWQYKPKRPEEPAQDRSLLEKVKLSRAEGLSVTHAKVEDPRPKLRAVQRYEVEVEQFEKDRKVYDEWRVEAEKVRRDVALLGDTQAELDRARQSDFLWSQYRKENAAYLQDLEAVTALERERDDLKAAVSATKEAKQEIKVYLLPSLSKAASTLIEAMTDGKHRLVEVDGDWEIRVDFQPLHTLSGSTKAAANLALRIGLGHVLTHKMFSVFLGDEIDAAMDSDRAQTTVECLTNLARTIRQIILVTHKDIPSQHRIVV